MSSMPPVISVDNVQAGAESRRAACDCCHSPAGELRLLPLGCASILNQIEPGQIRDGDNDWFRVVLALERMPALTRRSKHGAVRMVGYEVCAAAGIQRGPGGPLDDVH
jgi:hypothetical protein